MKYFYKKIIYNKKGFTMVETLVAITILMISIVGPLTIAQKSLMAAVYARDQVTASFLAQDLMEYLKNNRDANIDSPNFGSWKKNFDTIDGNCRDSSACRLYIQPDGTYGYGVTTKPSKFSRYTDIYDYKGKQVGEAEITVYVKWNNGTLVNIVKLKDHFFNVKL